MSVAFFGVQRLITQALKNCSEFTQNSFEFESSKSHLSTFGAGLFKTSTTERAHISVAPPQNRPSSTCGPSDPNLSGPGPFFPATADRQMACTRIQQNASKTQIPLRVARLLEQQSSPLSAGRMVISGRFSDVCAELDRLIAHQNQIIGLRK